MAAERRKPMPTDPCNTHVRGYFGEFTITGPANASSQVVFVETVLSLDADELTMQNFLSNLEVFREVFNVEDLDFTEIMQRDIDDCRVSTELIPYLLGISEYQHSFTGDYRGLSRFFPPIVGVLVPVDDAGSPEDNYPEVTWDAYKVADDHFRHRWMFGPEYDKAIARIERWADEQDDGKWLTHNEDATLHHNSNRCKVVIIDGQHRAMALLALYRNLQQSGWKDQRKPYAHYYEEWGESVLSEYNLSKVQLPMVICAFPEAGTEGRETLKETARNLFLTLNKTARRPHDTTHILLSDDEICTCVLKDFLTDIKSNEFGEGLDIHSVQLDHDKKARISSTMGLTSVDYLERLLFWLLLRTGKEINGTDRMDVGHAKSSFPRRQLPPDFQYRMNYTTHFTEDEMKEIQRFSFTSESRKKMYKIFHNKYGIPLFHIMSEFEPYWHSIYASGITKDKLSYWDHESQVADALFGGKGLENTLDEYSNRLTAKINKHEELFGKGKGEVETDEDDEYQLPSNLTKASTEISGIKESLDKAREYYYSHRTQSYLEDLLQSLGLDEKDDEEAYTEIVNQMKPHVNSIFNKHLNTRFHHYGIIMPFFHIVEKSLNGDNEMGDLPDEFLKSSEEIKALEAQEEFDSPSARFHRTIALDEYINTLDSIFKINDVDDLNRLLGVYLKKKVEIIISDEDGAKKASVTVEELAAEKITITEIYGYAEPQRWTRFIHMVSEAWADSEYANITQTVSDLKDKTRSQLVESVKGDYDDLWLLQHQKQQVVYKNVQANNLELAKADVARFISLFFNKDFDKVSAEIDDLFKEED